MSHFNAEYYALTHEESGMNATEKLVVGALVGFGASSLVFSVLGLVIYWVVG